MTDVLLSPEDTGEIHPANDPASHPVTDPADTGEATRNLAPYLEHRPALRSADAGRPGWAAATAIVLPTITVIPDLDSGLPALTFGTETERLTVLDSLGAGWPNEPEEPRAYAARHRDPQGRHAAWGKTTYEVLPAPEETHPVDVAANPLKLSVGLLVGMALGAAVYAGLVMAALVVIA